MLVLNTILDNLPIGSIRSSALIGNVTSLIINPNNLHIDGIWVKLVNNSKKIVTPEDIRGMTAKNIIIQDHEHLLDEDEAIRLKPIMDLNFQLIGLKTYVNDKKIGTVSLFSIDLNSFYIKKIYVKPNVLASLYQEDRIFDRSQIKEVTMKAIHIIDSAQVPVNNHLFNFSKLKPNQSSASAAFTSENE